MKAFYNVMPSKRQMHFKFCVANNFFFLRWMSTNLCERVETRFISSECVNSDNVISPSFWSTISCRIWYFLRINRKNRTNIYENMSSIKKKKIFLDNFRERLPFDRTEFVDQMKCVFNETKSVTFFFKPSFSCSHTFAMNLFH